MVHWIVAPATIRRLTLGCAALFVILLGSYWVVARAQTPSQVVTTVFPGAQPDGTVLLPNGWKLSPTGRHLFTGPMPLNVVTTPDAKYAVVSNDGLSKPTFTIVDLAKWTVKSTVTLDAAWLGLAWHPDGTRLYSAGAGQNNVQEFTYADGTLTKARTFALPEVSAGETFVGGGWPSIPTAARFTPRACSR